MQNAGARVMADVLICVGFAFVMGFLLFWLWVLWRVQ